ncbi:8908_t:CDS:2 [Paraglomus brasilianum]|uniref:8908_t:CDS:1 n=1 Tax=Paraglomus brasilianum TaxID=144538 RepID=A0A9N9ADF3_9GLOM|nr:8908_t:CDS:2 [Paraglomus brasilianum]
MNFAQELALLYPGRSSQISTLIELIGQPTDASPPVIFVYGHSSLGKTTIIKHIFTQLLSATHYAFINCVECHTESLLFEHALNQFAGITPSFENNFCNWVKCGDVNEFIVRLRECWTDDNARYLILDRAERLRDMSPTLLPALMNLPALSCKDLKELRYLASLLFPIYLLPVKEGTMNRSEHGKLAKNIQQYFKLAMDKLYLRDISSSEWIKHASEIENNQNGQSLTSRRIEVPYYTKFLLIAAFLASYNPPRLDQRYFVKSNEGRVTKRKRKSNKAEKSNGKPRQQLLGPKSFPIERMLAIFYSILPERIEGTVDIHMQVNIILNNLTFTNPNNVDNRTLRDSKV